MISPPLELLQANPSFAKAWEKISPQLTSEGLLLATSSIGWNAGDNLVSARKRYLEASCLLDAVEHKLYTATTSSTGDIEVATHTPTNKQAIAYEDMLDALTGLQVRQRLALPVELQPNTGAAPPTDVDSKLMGSLDHYLGVRPADLEASGRWARGDSRNEGGVALVAEVEAQLVSEAREVMDMLYRLANNTDMGKPPESIISKKLKAVSEASQSRHAAFKSTYQAACQHTRLLLQHVQVLLTLVCSCKLQRQLRVDEADVEYRSQHVQTLYKKALQMEANFLTQTYCQPSSTEMLNTCRKLSQLIEAAHHEATTTFKQVTSQLEAYDELGEDFQQLVLEYTGVLAEQAEADYTLQKFAELEQELQAELP